MATLRNNAPKFCNFAAMNKNFFIATTAVLGLASTGLMTGCDNNPDGEKMNYQVTCMLDHKLHRDSATLLVLEDEYNQLRVCGASRIANGRCSFTGQTDRPKVALLRWDNDSIRPFYFILEGGETRITINQGGWNITGSPQNRAYQQFIKQRNGIMDLRVATWQEYLKMAADSSLKHDDEVSMVRQDSLLNDSMQRITVECINRGDALGRIIRERYGQQLDQEHARQLK